MKYKKKPVLIKLKPELDNNVVNRKLINGNNELFNYGSCCTQL